MAKIEEISYMDEKTRIVNVIANRHFSYLKNKSVLELGPLDGLFSAKILEQTNQKVTLIEYDKEAVLFITKKFQSRVNVISGDIHNEIPHCGLHDAVVIYGVLYHSPHPFLILEDIVNYTNPEFILLEVWDLGTNMMTYHPEIVNQPGYRFSKLKTCGIALDIPMTVWAQVMANFGYNNVDQFSLKELDEYKQIKQDYPECNFKCDGVYTVWQRQT